MEAKRIVLITGANTGLGFQIVRALLGSSENYHVLLGGRSIQKAETAVKDVTTEFPSSKSSVSAVQIDIEDDASIEAAFNKVQTTYGRLDALVNNAGAMLDPQYHAGQMSMRDMWNKSWNVNVAGTQVTTHTFTPLLLSSSLSSSSSPPRLLFVASGTSTLTGSENSAMPFNRSPPPGTWPKLVHHLSGMSAYRSSKTGMNMMMREWHRNLKEDGVKVFCVSPGYLATGLGGSVEQNKQFGAVDPAAAGEFIRDVVEGKRDSDAGKVIMRDSVQPW